MVKWRQERPGLGVCGQRFHGGQARRGGDLLLGGDRRGEQAGEGVQGTGSRRGGGEGRWGLGAGP